MKVISLSVLLFVFVGCSGSGQKQEEPTTGQDDLEFVADSFGEEAAKPENTVEDVANLNVNTTEALEEKTATAEEVVAPEVSLEEKNNEMSASVVEKTMDEPLEPNINDFKEKPGVVEEVTLEENNKELQKNIQSTTQVTAREISKSETLGQEESYVVNKGETLMMIAFKIYGDYAKWKNLREWNMDKKRVTEGTQIKYYAPEQKFVWSPKGLPHMVKRGDTLQLISLEKYGTQKKWKSIFENNKPLIKDPNLIFVGFTVFYEPMRDLASGKK